MIFRFSRNLNNLSSNNLDHSRVNNLEFIGLEILDKVIVM